MSRAAEQPTAEQARQARDCVLAEAAAAGKRPSVLTVARRSGLSNTTFRRHFPDIARELSEARRTLQRLTPEARQLRTQLEAATNVIRIGTGSSTEDQTQGAPWASGRGRSAHCRR